MLFGFSSKIEIKVLFLGINWQKRGSFDDKYINSETKA